jgi:hypothetical protein
MTAADDDGQVEQTDNSAEPDAPDVPQDPDWRPW